MVDLGGSLAVASMGLYATGVSTDLNGKTTLELSCYAAFEPWTVTDEGLPVSYLSSGGKAGDTINVLAVCEKSKPSS